MQRKLPSSITNQLANYPVFYRKVWLECFNIPRGETITYKELAERLGNARSARAVGNALAKNPFAPYIPCHRVIKSDGGIGGYSGPGGIKTKREFIKRELNERMASDRKRPR